MVLSHARALLTSTPEGATAYLDADVHNPDKIIAQAKGTLDFSQPIAIMLIAILHYVPDLDEAKQIVDRLMSAVAPGSFLAISHAASDIAAEEMVEFIRRMNEHLREGETHIARRRDVVVSFFDGLELVEPGVVWVADWRPGSDVKPPKPTSMWGGVARKR
jgi:O-methyltransferase involved in polyketide biosynthesis